MNGRASSAVYSGTGRGSVSTYHRNEMPGQKRGSVCGSPYVSLSDIVNVVTGVDQHAHQYTQPDYGGNIVVEQPKPPPEGQPNPLVYQTQHSVPFGQQEQPSDKIEHCENSQDPAEFPPNNQRPTVDLGSLMTLHLGNSTISSNAQPVGVNDKDHPEQWSLTVHPNDINVGVSSTSGSGKLPGNNSVQLGRRDELDSPNQGASDIHFGETNPGDHKEQGSSTMHVAENSFGSSNTSVLARPRPSSNQAQLGGKDDKGNPNQGLSSTNCVEIHPDQITGSSSSEKVPVERAVSVNYDTEVAAHLHQKCPVEMSYNCFTKYFSSKNSKILGEGGFGKVYEGTVTVSLLSKCVMVSVGDGRGGMNIRDKVQMIHCRGILL